MGHGSECVSFMWGLAGVANRAIGDCSTVSGEEIQRERQNRNSGMWLEGTEFRGKKAQKAILRWRGRPP
jgi:hypothetical protein